VDFQAQVLAAAGGSKGASRAAAVAGMDAGGSCHGHCGADDWGDMYAESSAKRIPEDRNSDAVQKLTEWRAPAILLVDPDRRCCGHAETRRIVSDVP